MRSAGRPAAVTGGTIDGATTDRTDGERFLVALLELADMTGRHTVGQVGTQHHIGYHQTTGWAFGSLAATRRRR
jgi:hypothetical protein